MMAKRSWRYLIIIELFFWTAFLGRSGSAAAGALTLDAYLTQVQSGNPAVLAAQSAAEAARRSAEDAGLLTSPFAFADYSRQEDHSRQVDLFSGTSRAQSVAEFGLEGRTDFGLSARLAQQTSWTSVAGVDPVYLPEPDFYTARTSLALRQDLWRNAFGGEVRATAAAIRAKAGADECESRYQERQLLVQAEMAYWQLALAREAVRVQTDLLDRAQKLEAWTQSRARLKLTDRGDLLQAEAGVQMRRLELAVAQDREKTAARAFNLGRGAAEAAVADETPALEDAQWALPAWPVKIPVRLDVRAQERLAEAAARQAELGDEGLRPELQAGLTLAGNGLDRALNPAFSDSWTRRYFAYAAGVYLSVPLDWGTRARRAEGHRRAAEAAAQALALRRLAAEADWQDLRRRLQETSDRLALVRTLEELQKQKADYERGRLRTGNSVTYQVLVFEQDWGQSRLARMAVEGELLALLAQVKLYAE